MYIYIACVKGEASVWANPDFPLLPAQKRLLPPASTLGSAAQPELEQKGVPTATDFRTSKGRHTAGLFLPPRGTGQARDVPHTHQDHRTRTHQAPSGGTSLNEPDLRGAREGQERKGAFPNICQDIRKGLGVT